MSAFPPPTNGYFPGATFNSLYFIDENGSTVTKQYLEDNYLQRVGATTDIAVATTFTGDIIVEDVSSFNGDILLTGIEGIQSIQFPNMSKQYTAMNTLPISKTYTKATIQTDVNGAISSIANGVESSTFADNIILDGVQNVQYIQFPNLSKQYTALNTLPASQTYSNATIHTDANGGIASIANGSTPASSVPKASANGVSTQSNVSYSIYTNGGINGAWAQNTFFTIRYSISVCYNASAASPFQFQNNGTATGTMDIYPYRFGSAWCKSANAPNIAFLPNSINGNSNFNMVDTGTSSIGGVIAPSGREFWTYGSTNTGTNVFYIGGTPTSLYFQIANPSGWTSTASYTYDIMVELINTGANSSVVNTVGFIINF